MQLKNQREAQNENKQFLKNVVFQRIFFDQTIICCNKMRDLIYLIVEDLFVLLNFNIILLFLLSPLNFNWFETGSSSFLRGKRL